MPGVVGEVVDVDLATTQDETGLLRATSQRPYGPFTVRSISFLAERNVVILPPSVTPDTGRTVLA